MDRTRALSIIGAAAAGGFFPARASAATATIRMGSGLTDSSILTEVAQSLGLLERAGVAADIQFIPNGPATMAAMLGGSIDVAGSNSLSFLQARDKGLPLKIVAAQAVYRTGEASTALVVSASSAARTAADLNGKIVAVNPLGGSSHIAVQMWIDKNGGDSKAVRYVEVTFADMPVALPRVGSTATPRKPKAWRKPCTRRQRGPTTITTKRPRSRRNCSTSIRPSCGACGARSSPNKRRPR
jgi:NitT/TauT family transport system substrate-binding protein